MHRFIIAVVTPLWLAAIWLSPARAEEASREYLVKAAFVYNFLQFVEWPDNAFASADAPIIVGVVGTDPFNGALERVTAGKNINGHPIVVKHFDPADHLESCHLLFVPGPMDERLDQIFRTLGSHSVLTVGESEKFIDSGGAIRFFTEDKKIRFELNTDAIARASLKVSAKLAKLARIVHS